MLSKFAKYLFLVPDKLVVANIGRIPPPHQVAGRPASVLNLRNNWHHPQINIRSQLLSEVTQTQVRLFSSIAQRIFFAVFSQTFLLSSDRGVSERKKGEKRYFLSWNINTGESKQRTKETCVLLHCHF